MHFLYMRYFFWICFLHCMEFGGADVKKSYNKACTNHIQYNVQYHVRVNRSFFYAKLKRSSLLLKAGCIVAANYSLISFSCSFSSIRRTHQHLMNYIFLTPVAPTVSKRLIFSQSWACCIFSHPPPRTFFKGFVESSVQYCGSLGVFCKISLIFRESSNSLCWK